MSSDTIKIGVLALQGAIALHRPHIEAAGATYIEVTNSETLKTVDGLILPGGESGVMLKLIDVVGLKDDLTNFLKTKPAWGICAGAILIATAVHNPAQFSFSAIDIDIERNAYGRQLESSEDNIDGYQISYIRAPRITRVGNGVTIFAKRNQDPVWVESGKLTVTTFHPEINIYTPSPWHKAFAAICT
jgi:5'-phosphate synthase pdxT subunit